MTTTSRLQRIGILVGGGPAPGINGVIAAATIEARNNGLEVIGIPMGFKYLMEGRTDLARPLRIRDVSRIHLTGGSILGTARANPTKLDPVTGDLPLRNVVSSLTELSIDGLVTIGGDDTAYSAALLCEKLGEGVRVAHVPKTIDNDLPLPGGAPTFGYQTARHIGVHIAQNLMTDAQATQRWYLATSMGRHAGHLALGIGKAAGATLIIIAEEFGAPHRTIRLRELADIIETTILKRRVHGRPYGLIVISEGIGERLDEQELAQATHNGIELDEHGHVRLSEVELGRVLRAEVLSRFKKRGEKITLVIKKLGYELRCAPTIPFDAEYTRDLGYGAVRYLLDAGPDSPRGVMVTMNHSHLNPLPFDAFRNPETGRPLVRLVDVTGEGYQVARKYMIRLEGTDLQDPERLAALAEAASMSPEEFRNRFGYLTKLPRVES